MVVIIFVFILNTRIKTHVCTMFICDLIESPSKQIINRLYNDKYKKANALHQRSWAMIALCKKDEISVEQLTLWLIAFRKGKNIREFFLA